MWLANTFDFSRPMRGGARQLLMELISLNNATALKWLLDKYQPPLRAVFIPDDPSWAGAGLWNLGAHGRAGVARVLAAHYHLVPREPKQGEIAPFGSLDAPPTSRRLSEVNPLSPFHRAKPARGR